MKNQYVLVRRRISRTETTGKSFIYSAVQQADANANRKKSIQLATQKIYCKSEFTGTTQPQQSEVSMLCFKKKKRKVIVFFISTSNYH